MFVLSYQRFLLTVYVRNVTLKVLAILLLCFSSVVLAQEEKSNAEVLEELAQAFSGSRTLVGGRFAEDEQLIMSADIANISLGEFFALAKSATIFFDFDEYVRVLDFQVKFESSTNQYIGWYIEENNTFKLSLTDGIKPNGDLEVNLAQANVIIPSTKYTFVDDILYIDEQVLSDIFTVEHDFNYQRLQVSLKPTGKFPLLDKLSRQNKMLRNRNNKDPSFLNLPRYYELLSPQVLDVRLNSSYRENTEDLNTTYSVQGARDLALLHTQFSLTGSNRNTFSNGRLSFSRDSREGHILGNTGITKIEFGDVRNVRQVSGSSSAESLGVKIQNGTLGRLFDYEFINIDGDAPIGWDAELYRNGTLVSQKLNIESGRYEFLDTPLSYGQNNFEVVLYGPQGQVRKRTIRRLVDEKISSPDRFSYQASLSKLNTSLLGINDANLNQNLGYNFSARGTAFVQDGLAINFGVQSIFGGDLSSNNASVGSSTVLFDDTLVSADLGFSDDGVISLNTSVRANVLGQAVSATYANFDLNGDDALNTHRFGLSVDGSVTLTDSLIIPLSQSISLNENNASTDFRYSNSFGYRSRLLSLFHNIEYRRVTVDGLSNDTLDGGINIQSNFGRVFTRLSASYSRESDSTFDSLIASVNWQPVNSLRMSLSASKSLINNAVDGNFTLGYIGDNFTLNGRVGHSDLVGFDLGISASFSVSGQSATYERIDSSSISGSSTGSLGVRVFFDKNLNAVFDEGDSVLPNVTVEAVQFHKKAKTDITGVAVLPRLTNQRSSDITIDSDTLPESFLVPLIQGVSITARSGLVDSLDFPVVISSELEGIAEVNINEELLPLKRTKLNLIDSNGNVVKSALTEYDGYYVFTGIIPGNYALSIDAQDTVKFDLVNAPTIKVHASFTPEIIIKDFTVQQRRYIDGYIAQLGAFKNMLFAKTLTQTLEAKNSQIELFIETDKASSLIRIFADFSTSQQNIEDVCTQLRLSINTCEVVPFRFPLQ